MRKILALTIALTSQTAFSQTLDDRVKKLEEEIQSLKAAVGLIMLANSSNTGEKADKFEPKGEGWRDIRNWRKLEKGMPPAQVTSILGEPTSVNSGPFTFWHYQSGGKVDFYDGVVYGWDEPRY